MSEKEKPLLRRPLSTLQMEKNPLNQAYRRRRGGDHSSILSPPAADCPFFKALFDATSVFSSDDARIQPDLKQAPALLLKPSVI